MVIHELALERLGAKCRHADSRGSSWDRAACRDLIRKKSCEASRREKEREGGDARQKGIQTQGSERLRNLKLNSAPLGAQLTD